jgi:transcriptional regulator with XRE-family HTH domain
MPYELRNQPISIENVIVHLGVEVRDARLARYESQSRLSTRCGVSQSTWSMVENGLAEGVRLETLARIAGVLQLDLVLRPCPHSSDAGRYPPNGRTRRLAGATRVPGTTHLEPGADWDPRRRW